MKDMMVAATLKAGRSVNGGLTFFEADKALPEESLFSSIVFNKKINRLKSVMSKLIRKPS